MGKNARRWTLRLIGDPALVSPGGEEHPLERRAAALMALAAIEPGLSRRQAAALLWPASDDAKARQALRQQLLRLKTHAGRELVTGHEVLRLAADVVTDLEREDLDGTLLGRLHYGDEEDLSRWVEHHRAARLEGLSARLRAALAQAEQENDPDAASRLSQRLVRIDPDNEQNHRAVMRAHYLAGDVAAAQAAYDRLRAMLERDFGARPSAETEQLARTIRHALDAPAMTATHRPPPSVLRPPRLIGRQRQWDLMQECWSAPRVAIVAGVAGLGKTRLLADFAASHAPVAFVSSRPGDALVAYSLLARVLRSLVARVEAPIAPGVRLQLASLLPELGVAEPIRDKAGHARLMRAVEALCEQSLAEGLAGIVLDDLHYADAASIEALQTSVCGNGRIPFIVSCRRDELGEAACAFLDALVASGGRRIDLSALDVEEVRELLLCLDLEDFAAASLAPEIARHTGGNPFFVLETVKAMLLERRHQDVRLPVAGSVAALIERRLQRLSPGATRIARCAAVAGQDFSMELAGKVLGARPLDLADAWAELDAVQVFSDGAFVHDLVYETTLASVPKAIARRMHAEIAACLASSGAEPARIGVHWEAAREGRKAGEAFVRAAALARTAGRRIEEAYLLERAARSFEARKDRDAAFESQLARAEAMIFSDLGDAALNAVLAAESAARGDDQKLRALLARAEYVYYRGDAEAAVEAGWSGIKLARLAGHEVIELRFIIVVAGGLSELRRVEEALALLEPLRESARVALAPRWHVDFLVQLGICLDLANRLSAALVEFERARAIAQAEGLRDHIATTLSNLATTTSKCGRLTRAVEYGRQALQLARESEPLRGTPLQTQTLLAHRLRDVGHYEEAIAMLEDALAEFRRAGTLHWISAAGHRLALAYSHVGQHARALKLLADEPVGQPVKAQAIWLAHRAEAARLGGGDAVKPIRAALSLVGGDVDDGNNRLVNLFASAIVPAAEGESMATAVAAWAEARERFGMAVAAHIRAASCALAQERVDRALPHVEAALRLFADSEPDNFYRGEVWWVAAQVFGAAKANTRARRAIAEGCEWIRRVAAEHVPAPYRDSFLKRNPVNRALLAAERSRQEANTT